MHLDSGRADRRTALVLFALGAAMLYGGYTMDRLEIRQIHPASIPGLVPMLLGAALASCAALLFASAGAGSEPGAAGALAWRSVGLALVLCLVYAVGLVGRVPFFWATAAFVGAFAALFGWRDGEGARSLARTTLVSAGFGLAVSGAVAALFRYGFLVRLP